MVFIHGLWLLPSSWASWADFFSLANKTLKQVADHTTEVINALDKQPAIIGHSTGGCRGRSRTPPTSGSGATPA